MQSIRMVLNARVFFTMALVAMFALIVVFPTADQNISAQPNTVDICDRTPQIEEAISKATSQTNPPVCEDVTSDQVEPTSEISVGGDRMGS
ncbi:MAG: hypothetical protein OXC83_03670 [Chloroflexi bacterium]|nr:hypothetical protein [Chloroflexota bacterium]